MPDTDHRTHLCAGWRWREDEYQDNFGAWHGGLSFTPDECEHGRKALHSLGTALRCGMLQAVRAERGLTQEQLAKQLRVTLSTVARWEQGTRTPTGLYRERLEQWLTAAG